jgi:hypothetical protein
MMRSSPALASPLRTLSSCAALPMAWRIVMHSVEARPAGQCLLSCEPLIRWTVALCRLGAIFARIFGRGRRQDHVVPGYEGYGWCDSSERQFIDHAAR